MQANSIEKGDKIISSKKAKGEDFTEHKNILEQALVANPCTERRVATTGRLVLLSQKQKKTIFSFGIQRRLKS